VDLLNIDLFVKLYLIISSIPNLTRTTKTVLEMAIQLVPIDLARILYNFIATLFTTYIMFTFELSHKLLILMITNHLPIIQMYHSNQLLSIIISNLLQYLILFKLSKYIIRWTIYNYNILAITYSTY